jgi:ABC-type branched-subunit amino acid transport system substrate-binding protein
LQTAFKQINAAGGAGTPKRKIDVTVADTQCTASGAQAAFQQAVANGAQVVVTGSVSTTVSNIRPLASQAQIPLVSAGGLDALFTGGTSWFYAAQAPSDQAAYAEITKMTEFLGGSLKGKKLAITGTAPGAANDTAIANMQTLFENGGGTVVDVERTAFGLTSFASGAGNIMSKAPDGVIISAGGPDTVVTAKALLDAGFKGPIMGGSGASDDTTIQAVGSTQYSALREQNQATATNTMGKTAKKYGFDFTGSYWPKGWVNAYTVKLILDKCKYPCPPASFQKAAESLGSFTVPGDAAIGPLLLNATRHYSNTAVQFYTWDPSKSIPVAAGDPTPLTPGTVTKKAK